LNGTTPPSTAAASLWPNPSSLSCPANCLDRRILDQRSLERRVALWLVDRNTYNVRGDCRCTAADAASS
jgi:hypothetical protein